MFCTEHNSTRSRVFQTITSLGDPVYGIWNTTAGSDSVNATVGTLTGQYPSSESPPNAIDNNVGTKYTSFGNGSISVYSSTKGVGTGFYITPAVGSSVATGILFATANDNPPRDPITITMEGSNANTNVLLQKGTSWTLLYNGPTGILQTMDPGRNTFVQQQNFTNTNAYTSYRILVTSQRGSGVCTQYSEAQIIGFV
ncbi:unnamed protein product [Didymodactylos carnosus]|uniref:Uncharacterized protein n=1 Tax=Didymodactylos carnosus TaxID=1234261 RepID=A0A815HNZ9_9BILA|nr:unnamed protein product [Didymodactylos carnosus]CAF1354232.1 unnamed protein product [Didymodactylos carnosus]CAF3646761.1 unnamed protein product [Didymodactylos carnosus]CAF4226829.1 unnamed protein product [Didymodactylos carnosus]